MEAKKLFKVGVLAFAFPLALPGQFTGTGEEILIWNGPGPGSDTLTIEQTVTERALQGACTIDRAAEHITQTGIVPFIAGEPNGSAVVICPGGGYSRVVMDKEGTDVAEWFNSFGISAFVVKYRLPVDDHVNKHLVPLQDAQRALRYVRGHAAGWGIDPGRIGIMGFSAGGHLTVMAGTQWDQKTYDPIDEADNLSCRPDFLIPIYPAYLGDSVNPDRLSPLVRITRETPPAFIAVTYDDKDRAIHSALLLIALKRVGVPAEWPETPPKKKWPGIFVRAVSRRFRWW